MPTTQIVPVQETQTDTQTDTQRLPANLNQLFGGDVAIGNEAYQQDAKAVKWLLWDQAVTAWLDQKFTQSEHTGRAYQIAVETFFSWAEFYAGEPVYPGDVASAMSTSFAAWLRREGKAVERDPDTGGGAPWDRNGFNPRHAPNWLRWQDDGEIYLREHDRENDTITITRRGPLAVSSTNLKLAALRNLYDFVAAKYNAQLPDGNTFSLWPADRINPFDPNLIERNKPPERRAVYPSINELQSVLAHINTDCLTGKRDFALILGLTQTCRRYTEWIGLRWGDIDHEPIPDGPHAGDHTYTFGVAKKRREEIVDEILDRNIYTAICQYLNAAGRLDREAGIEPTPDEYIWTPIYPERIAHLHPDATPDKLIEMATTPISNGTVNAILKKYGRRADVDEAKLHVHALRHAGARLRYDLMKRQGNVDPQVVQMVLRHQSLGTTMGYIQKNLETPEDPGGREAAIELLRGAQKRHTNKGEPEVQQGAFFSDDK